MRLYIEREAKQLMPVAASKRFLNKLLCELSGRHPTTEIILQHQKHYSICPDNPNRCRYRLVKIYFSGGNRHRVTYTKMLPKSSANHYQLDSWISMSAPTKLRFVTEGGSLARIDIAAAGEEVPQIPLCEGSQQLQAITIG